MKFLLCAYRDIELEKYQPLFAAQGSLEDLKETLVEGAIKGIIKDCAHKEVFVFGTFETADGKIEMMDKPQKVIDLSTYGKADTSQS